MLIEAKTAKKKCENELLNVLYEIKIKKKKY
jgi:hypothetical protein